MFKEKLAEMAEAGKSKAQSLKIAASTAVMVVGPAISAYAADASGGADVNYLEGAVWESIQKGFNGLAVTATQVVSIAVVTGCGIVGMTAASKYAMKKIRGVLDQAS